MQFIKKQFLHGRLLQERKFYVSKPHEPLLQLGKSPATGGEWIRCCQSCLLTLCCYTCVLMIWCLGVPGCALCPTAHHNSATTANNKHPHCVCSHSVADSAWRSPATYRALQYQLLHWRGLLIMKPFLFTLRLCLKLFSPVVLYVHK